MRNFRLIFVVLFCASLAAGILGAQNCQPSFTRLDPQQITAGTTATVFLYGNCIPTDMSLTQNGWLQVGFSDPNNPEGLPVRIVGLEPTRIMIQVTAPESNRISRRQLSVKLGGSVVKTMFFLRINPTPGAAPSGGQAGAASQIEYVTRPVLFRAIRRAEARADHAVGLANQANQQVTVVQNAVTSMGDRFVQYFGADGNSGIIGTRLTNVENGLVEHKDAIIQLRQEIDRINSGLAAPTIRPEDFQDLAQRVAALENVVQTLLHTRVKTGIFHKQELGRAAGLQTGPPPQPGQAPPPPGGGYNNPIQ